ncbi:plasmid recombination protein [Pseudomonas lutea]|uniref:Plasmid recombination protein n=1 Tax=Pseudomonas lutea TaxID=243924 RepID=A0ABR9ACY7_9PSED|nr:MobV family relaxase [Pseudomonas lutea]MBD8123850.1 plasmid recombination protein [Pseudomonas lutea]
MYSIIRTKKLKSFGAISRSGRHTFREQLTPNANPDIRNKFVGAKTTTQLIDKLKAKLPSTIRSNAVLCIEYMITASPEAFKRHGGHLDDMGNGYFNDSLKWLRAKHGQENVIGAAIHLDESTPHLVAYVVPITSDHRLSCRDFLGGPAKMKKMHSDFSSICGEPRNLKRGIEGGKAKHQDIKSFYASLNASGDAPKLTARDYAAAAIGIKTAAWRKAELLAKSNGQSAAIFPVTRKRLESRERTLNRLFDSQKLKTKEIEDQHEIIGHRRILLEQAEYDLQQRTRSVLERENAVSSAAQQIHAVEAERDALERRLEMYQDQGRMIAAPVSRGRKSYVEISLG